MLFRSKVDSAVSPIPRSTPSRALPPVASRTVFTNPVTEWLPELAEPTVVSNAASEWKEWLPSVPFPIAAGASLCIVGGAFVLQAHMKNKTITWLRNELTEKTLQLAAKNTELTESNITRVHLESIIADLKLRERSPDDDAFLQNIVEAYVSNEQVLNSNISALTSNIAGLKVNIAGLTATISGLKVNVTALKARNAHLQGRNDYLSKAFITCTVLLKRTNERLESSQRSEASSQAMIASLQLQLETTVADKDGVTSERDQLRSELSTAKTRIGTLRAAADTSSKGFKKEILELKEQNLKKDKELDCAKDKISAMTDAAEESSNALASSKQEINNLKGQISAKDKDLEVAHGEVSTMKEAARVSSKVLDSHKQETDSLKAQILRLKEQVEASNAHKTKSDTALSKSEDVRKSMEENVKTLTSEKSELAAKAKDLQASRDKSIEAKDKAERESNDLKAQVSHLEGRVETHAATSYKFRVENNKLSVLNAGLEKSVAEMSSQNKVLKEQLDAKSKSAEGSSQPIEGLPAIKPADTNLPDTPDRPTDRPSATSIPDAVPKGQRQQKKSLKNADRRAEVLEKWTDNLTTADVVFEGLRFDDLANLCKGFTADQTEAVIPTAVRIAKNNAAPGINALKIGHDNVAEAISEVGKPQIDNRIKLDGSSRNTNRQPGNAGGPGAFAQPPNPIPQSSNNWGLGNSTWAPKPQSRPSALPSFNAAPPPTAPTRPAAQVPTGPPPIDFQRRINVLKDYKHSTIGRADGIDFKWLAYEANQFNGPQIHEAIENAASKARKEKRHAITQKDIEDGIALVQRTITDARRAEMGLPPLP